MNKTDNLKLSKNIIERVYQDIGQASMCWEHVEKAGVFDSSQASDIGYKLCEFIQEELDQARKRIIEMDRNLE